MVWGWGAAAVRACRGGEGTVGRFHTRHKSCGVRCVCVIVGAKQDRGGHAGHGMLGLRVQHPHAHS